MRHFIPWKRSLPGRCAETSVLDKEQSSRHKSAKNKRRVISLRFLWSRFANRRRLYRHFGFAAAFSENRGGNQRHDEPDGQRFADENDGRGEHRVVEQRLHLFHLFHFLRELGGSRA